MELSHSTFEHLYVYHFILEYGMCMVIIDFKL